MIQAGLGCALCDPRNRWLILPPNSYPFMFFIASPINRLLAHMIGRAKEARHVENHAKRRSVPAQFPSSGLTLVDVDATPPLQIVGVSAAWRKLLMQAEMAAPHVQVAAIEGEHGTGKQTLARYLFSRSPCPAPNFSAAMPANGWSRTPTPPASRDLPISIASICLRHQGRGFYCVF